MKILLIGNYLPDRQHSMQLYASLLDRGLRARGHQVHLLYPPAVLGQRAATVSPLSKWLGYVDKFVLFRSALRRAAAQADVVHVCDHSNAMYVPAIQSRPHVVTCHDILAIRSAMGHFPENRIGATGRIFQRLIARGLRQARTILCVSEKTRDDLEAYLEIPESRLHVVANALPRPCAPLRPEQRRPLLATLGLTPDEPYFFQLGSHWYKNRSAVIRIFAELRKLPLYSAARLVLAGGPLNEEQQALLREYRLAAAVLEVAAPSDEQLTALYSGALVTLFPSLEEGFGWPILESQACGCPVAIADRAPMNQIAGGAAIFIDPARPADAARAIAEALTDSEQLRTDGLRNAAAYTPERMLDQYEALYRQALTSTRSRQ